MADAPRIQFGRDGRKVVHLDVAKLIVTRMLVQANSGGGKSYAVRVLAEKAMHHVQTIVIDPDGEFASLRELHDVLLVGENGDLSADPRGAALLARRLFEKRCSAVIDLYELDPPDREEFVRDFCDALVKIPKQELAAAAHPMLIIIDEAQDFCPERSRGTSVATKAVVSLMARGRKRGMGVCLATQRMSEINKSASSTANNYLCGRTAQDTDRKRVAQDLGLEKADSDGLRNLDEGQFWAVGPAFSHKDCRKIRVALAETTHPEPGTAMPPPPPASRRIRALIGKEFSDLPEHAQEEAATLQDALTAGRALKRENADLRKKLERADPDAERRLRTAQDELDATVELAAKAVEDLDRAKERLTGIKPRVAPDPPPPRARSGPAESAPTARGRSNGKDEMTPAEQRLLDALAWLEAAGVSQPDRNQLAWSTGCSPRNSGYEKRLGKMKNDGWIHYPEPGHVELTDTGRASATPPDVPPTSEQLQAMIYSKLPPRRVKILRALVERWPDDYDRPQCADVVGVSPRNSGYEKDLGAMRTLKLVVYPQKGRVRASPVMFLN